MSDHQPEYRIRQYRPGAWCIDQRFVYGEKAKRAGEEYWKEIKYPGTLAQASERLLSLVTGLDVEMDVVALKNAVIASEAQISANVEAYVMAVEGNDGDN